MTAWTSDELTKIGAADELRLASRRQDGTLRRPVIVWVVRHGDDLFVRSWHGRTAAWFRGTQDRHEGRIQAGGIERDIAFEEADQSINDAIDAAYRTKYGHYSGRYVDEMVAAEAQAATVKLVPRSGPSS